MSGHIDEEEYILTEMEPEGKFGMFMEYQS